jgi:hypothetical protein
MTSTIFLTVALVATAIFLIQFIVSIFFGEIDTDVDMDADIGSVISFKGLTHFCIGMGWYMYITQGTEISSYVAGILVGLVFVFVLWFLYKKAWQLQKEKSTLLSGEILSEKAEAMNSRITITLAVPTTDLNRILIALNRSLIFC